MRDGLVERLMTGRQTPSEEADGCRTAPSASPHPSAANEGRVCCLSQRSILAGPRRAGAPCRPPRDGAPERRTQSRELLSLSGPDQAPPSSWPGSPYGLGGRRSSSGITGRYGDRPDHGIDDLLTAQLIERARTDSRWRHRRPPAPSPRRMRRESPLALGDGHVDPDDIAYAIVSMRSTSPWRWSAAPTGWY